MQNSDKLKLNLVQSNSKQNSDWHVSKQFHAEAFKTIYCCIDNAIIKENKGHKVNNLNNYYQGISEGLGGAKLEGPFSSALKIENKINDFYDDKIKI